ncbi:unnamed protein product [Sphagnum troendelagicum]|uniref:Uncharacterized protein n=1 Tax=Sphagnum troendelagicum TaxID=128251 RepID=A0ABP0TRJ2_9BRYO
MSIAKSLSETSHLGPGKPLGALNRLCLARIRASGSLNLLAPVGKPCPWVLGLAQAAAEETSSLFAFALVPCPWIPGFPQAAELMVPCYS